MLDDFLSFFKLDQVDGVEASHAVGSKNEDGDMAVAGVVPQK